MPTELPKTVKVGAFTWTVESSAKTTLALALDGRYGDTNLDQLTIRVRGDIHPVLQRETLLHEMIHAALMQTPLAEQLTADQQEAVCRGLSPFLLEHLFVSGWTEL
jgi:hypothetical protein